MTEQEQDDQRRFDQEVATKGKVVLQALAGLGIFAALLMSIIALTRSGTASSTGMMSPVAARVATAQTAAPAAAPAKTVALKIVGSYRKGPEGKLHDAFTTTDFAVKVGQPLTLRIDNTDDVPHSITSAVAGVNIITQPGVHTYTLLVKSAGRFEWTCMLPCDSDAGGWAMTHPGYMSGYITAS
ncbi:MAG TPA: hypothetical protein VID29_06810 [Solirubrobacteraceae bacterium]|jgi:hypothetical protein